MNLNINDKYISTNINELDKNEIYNQNDKILKEFLQKQELRKQKDTIFIDEYNIDLAMKQRINSKPLNDICLLDYQKQDFN